MNVAKDRVVSIDYIIQLADGTVVESSTADGALTYLHGRGDLVDGIEQAIDGLTPGDVCQVKVSPSEGFGDRNPRGVFLIPRAAFPDEGELIAPGMTFSAKRTDGDALRFSVLDASGEQILVDTNHPLAGQVLLVWIAVRSVREASYEELAFGRALYGPSASVPMA